MEGFKVNPKMAKNLPCYKEGGSVKYKSRHSEKTEMKEDVAKDKAIVKKAVKMHDEQQHGGEKTDLAKLKKGGRMKKEGGCVGRYKSGGGISYGAKKTKEDRKEIAAIKRMKPKVKTGGSDVAKDGGKMTGGADIKTGMTTGSSDVAKEGSMTGGLNNVFKKGGHAKKYADGGMVTEEEKARMPAGKLPQQVVDEEAMASNTETREMVAGPLRKLKQGIMEKFKSKSKTPVAPMKKGGKAC
jgi:hypothetical protein